VTQHISGTKTAVLFCTVKLWYKICSTKYYYYFFDSQLPGFVFLAGSRTAPGSPAAHPACGRAPVRSGASTQRACGCIIHAHCQAKAVHAAPRVRTEAAQKWTSGHTRPVGDAMTRIDDEMTRKGRPEAVRNNVKV
jgi:hypothetical protein